MTTVQLLIVTLAPAVSSIAHLLIANWLRRRGTREGHAQIAEKVASSVVEAVTSLPRQLAAKPISDPPTTPRGEPEGRR